MNIVTQCENLKKKLKRVVSQQFMSEFVQNKNSDVACKSVAYIKKRVYNNKCMIASTQTTNTEIFAFIAFLVFSSVIEP